MVNFLTKYSRDILLIILIILVIYTLTRSQANVPVDNTEFRDYVKSEIKSLNYDSTLIKTTKLRLDSLTKFMKSKRKLNYTDDEIVNYINDLK